ncbi:MOP flippase family protein [Chitinophaga sp. MM2321]|uniref:MOP flippase family protein n=1 Tax=Chitinophaga sp. MM2321 TaxID=3137178 RepID=UPI0032D569ED
MSINKSVVSGTSWTAVSMGTQVLVQLLRLSILTRFLSKSDFGLIAIVTLVLGFTHIFTDLGISVALFSRQNITKKEYSSLYWISLLSGIALYIIILLLTPLISIFYQLEILNILIPIMGLDLVIATAGRQFKVFKQKELRFKEIALIEIFSALLSLILSVVLAFNNLGVYSLVYATIFNSFLSSFLYIITSLKKHPVSFYINFNENRSLYKVGAFQTGAQILDFISSQMDIIIIGKLMGPAELGVYNLIKQLLIRPSSLLAQLVQNVGIPVLARIRNDVKAFKRSYLQLLKIVSLIGFPIYAIIALYAKEILLILFGKAYVSAALPLQILSVWGAVVSLLGPASVLVVVTGKTNLGFNWTIFRVLTIPIFIIVGGSWGILGISVGQAICVLLYLFLYWFVFIKRVVDIPFRDYTFSFLPTVLSTGLGLLLAIIVKTIVSKWVHVYIADVLALVIFATFFLRFNKRVMIEFYKLFFKKD